MSKELEALEKGILEFEKDLEDDCNNEWLKRVVAGMKKCYQRLEEIEKSQEEIGMDLLLALKCLLTDKFYFISKRTNKVEYKSPTARSLKYKSMIFAFDNTTVEFKDYGKTFAVTKEELESE